MKIALALIVRGTNEEALLLDRCLDTIAPYVDGIFITRTHKKGEKPNHAVGNVAANYKAHISDFEWVDDFSKARNFNFSQVPKEFDFIMWCDADDVWRGVEKLKPTLEKHKHADGFGLWYLYGWDEYKKPTVVHRKTMIIKNDGCASWVGALHEELIPNRDVSVPLIEGIDRMHLSSQERAKENDQRNLRIAQKEVKEMSEDPRSYWNLANSQFSVSDFQGAKESFLKFIDNSHAPEEVYLAHARLSNVYKSLGKREECIKELQFAIGLDPQLPDAYFQMAAYQFDFGNLDKAEQYLLQGLVKRPQIMKMVVYNPRDYDYNPMMLLANIYNSMNRPDLMLPLLKGCLKIYPGDKKLKEHVKKGEKDKALLGKALLIAQKLQKIKDKKKLKIALEKVPAELQSHPAISVIRNVNFIKDTSSGNDLVIYCGSTIEQWSPETFKTKMVGGSEEAVIHLAGEFAKLGWHVTVYNNCGHKALTTEFINLHGHQSSVTFRPFWEWNYRDKQDIVIIWRTPKVLEAEINAPKIFVDMHDVVSDGEWTENRLKRVTKVMVKSQFHRSLFPSIPDEKIAVIPNGLEIYLDKTIKKDPYLIINTSSPDRSMDVLPKLFKEIKKKVPKARLQWAYSWEGFVNAHRNDAKKMQWMENTKKEIAEAGIEVLGRLSQKEVGELYQRASVFAYPTEFAEIDCISVKKAQAAGCLPVTTDFGALKETNYAGLKIHSTKTKDNWNRPYQFHFGLEGEKEQKLFVGRVCEFLYGSGNPPLWREEAIAGADKYTWPKIADKWNKEFI